MKLKINAFILLCLSVIAIAVSSCDSDKEESACDEQNYNRVVRLLHTEDGRELFPEISGSDLRFVGFQSPDIAKGFVSGLVAREWDGTKSISCDFHEYGTMKVSAVSASSDVIYGNIYFNLKDMKPFRLVMTSNAYLRNLIPDGNDGEDSFSYPKAYACPKCGAVYVEYREQCETCGSKLYEIPVLTIVPLPNLPIDDVDIDFGMEV